MYGRQFDQGIIVSQRESKIQMGKQRQHQQIWDSYVAAGERPDADRPDTCLYREKSPEWRNNQGEYPAKLAALYRMCIW